MPLEQIDKVDIIGDDDSTGISGRLEYGCVRCSVRLKVEAVHVFDAKLRGQTSREQRWQLGVYPDRAKRRAEHASRGQHGVVEPAGGVLKAGSDIVRFQIRILVENRLVRFAGSKQLKNIGHADAHPPDARSPAALIGVDRDPFEQ